MKHFILAFLYTLFSFSHYGQPAHTKLLSEINVLQHTSAKGDVTDFELKVKNENPEDATIFIGDESLQNSRISLDASQSDQETSNFYDNGDDDDDDDGDDNGDDEDDDNGDDDGDDNGDDDGDDNGDDDGDDNGDDDGDDNGDDDGDDNGDDDGDDNGDDDGDDNGDDDSCNGCSSTVSASFDGCDDCVYVSSCKELSNVVLLLCDGTEFKYDNLNVGKSSTFCSPDGQNILGVWVKAGCNKSGDGPGYGQFIDGPCSSGSCGGDNDNGEETATLNGHVYHDMNGNGRQDAGEPDIAHLDVTITDVNNASQTVTTDANGNWTATVPPGNTKVFIDNNSPGMPPFTGQTEGTDPSMHVAVAGANTFTENDGFAPTPDLTTGIVVNVATINEGGTVNVTYNYTNLGPASTNGNQIEFKVYKLSNYGRLTMSTEPSGWSITDKGNYYSLKSTTTIEKGIPNNVSFNAVFVHDGADENAVIKLVTEIVFGSGGEMNFTNNYDSQNIQVN